MKYLGTIKLLTLNDVSATGFIDFQTSFGGAGVVAYITTSDPQGAPNFSFSLSALNPDGNVVSLITSPAVVNTSTSLRIGVLPGVTAVANVIANEVIPGQGRFTYTKAGGTSYDINVWLAFFG